GYTNGFASIAGFAWPSVWEPQKGGARHRHCAGTFLKAESLFPFSDPPMTVASERMTKRPGTFEKERIGHVPVKENPLSWSRICNAVDAGAGSAGLRVQSGHGGQRWESLVTIFAEQTE